MKPILQTNYAHFHYLALYNREANRQLVEAIEKLPPDAVVADRGSYFSSILGILTHIYSADVNWLRRFREIFGDMELLKSPHLEPAGHAWQQHTFDGFGTFKASRAAMDVLLLEWVETCDAERFTRVLRYRDSRDQERSYEAGMALLHVFNHQTHHRGQVSQILDSLGVEHDFSNFFGVLPSPK